MPTGQRDPTAAPPAPLPADARGAGGAHAAGEAGGELRRVERRQANESRLVAGLALLACAAVLVTAVLLPPDPRSYGTHERVFGGPCGFLVVTGLPCPTCGMTTAFAHVVRGQLLSALRAQPAGFVLAVLTILAVPWSLVAMVRGRWPDLQLWRVPAWVIFLGAVLVFIAAWGIKIATGLSDGSLPYR
ncbi:MAG: DUF2752 domain-containing protein [Phycisphaerales bacterium]|nr:DUF2752 domain-containing protein [Phycisphaerales bacterium]